MVARFNKLGKNQPRPHHPAHVRRPDQHIPGLDILVEVRIHRALDRRGLGPGNGLWIRPVVPEEKRMLIASDAVRLVSAASLVTGFRKSPQPQSPDGLARLCFPRRQHNRRWRVGLN